MKNKFPLVCAFVFGSVLLCGCNKHSLVNTRLGIGCCGSKNDVHENAHRPLGQREDDKRPRTPQTPLVSSPNSSTVSPNKGREQGSGASEENVDAEEQEEACTPKATVLAVGAVAGKEELEVTLQNQAVDDFHNPDATNSGSTSTTTVSENSSSNVQILETLDSVGAVNIEEGASQGSTPRSIRSFPPALQPSSSVPRGNAINAQGLQNDDDSMMSIPSLAVAGNPQDYGRPSQYNEESTSASSPPFAIIFQGLSILKKRGNYQRLNSTDSMSSVPSINPSTDGSTNSRSVVHSTDWQTWKDDDGSSRNNSAATVQDVREKKQKSRRSSKSVRSAPAAVRVPSSNSRQDLEDNGEGSRSSVVTSRSGIGRRSNRNGNRLRGLSRRGVDIVDSNDDQDSVGSSLASIPEDTEVQNVRIEWGRYSNDEADDNRDVVLQGSESTDSSFWGSHVGSQGNGSTNESVVLQVHLDILGNANNRGVGSQGSESTDSSFWGSHVVLQGSGSTDSSVVRLPATDSQPQ